MGEDVYDLSEYSLLQFLLMPLAVPIILFLKAKEVIEDWLWVLRRWIDAARARHREEAKKRASFCKRCNKTMRRWKNNFKDVFKSSTATPASMVVPTQEPMSLSELRSLNNQLDNERDKETEEEQAKKIEEEAEK